MVIDLDAHRPATAVSTPGRPNLRSVAWAAVLLAVLVLGGSAGPPPALRWILTVDHAAGTFTLAPDAVFTAGFGRAPGRQTIVRRVALDGSGTRWRTELPQTVGRLTFSGATGVLVAEPARVLMTTAADAVEATFLDADSGEVLWRTRSSGLLRVADDGALIVAGTQVRRADLRTGQTRWTAELEVAPQPGFDYIADGDRLYLHMANRALTAYRLPSLEKLWEEAAVPPGPPVRCGPAHLCLAGDESLTVLNSETGAVRWTDDRWRLDPAATGTATRIAVIDAPTETGRALLDPDTGEILAELGAGAFVGTHLLRPHVEGAGRAWVYAVGPRHDLRTVGSLDAAGSSRCVDAAGHLACPTTSGQLRIWQLPT